MSAVSERDSRGMTPIHYCVCSQEYSNSAINCLSVLEALLSPIRGGRGDFFQTDAKSEKNNSSRKKSGKQTIEVKAKRFLTEAIWFQREAIYNSVTGQQVVALQEANNQPLFRSTASPKTSLSSSLTLNRQKLSLSDLTAQYPVDSSLYSSPSDDYSPEKSLKVDYEVIIPWLVRNIYKRASIMGERLGSSPIDILEELVELVDCDFTRTLIVPEIKDLLKSLGIMVTDDIVKELCNMYPGSIEIVQHKWETINRGDTKFIDEDDSDEENQPVEKKSSKGINKGAKMTKQTKQGNSKSSSKSQSLMSDLYDEDETKMADSKETEEKVNKKKMTVKYHPDEEYGLDFNKLVDDIASGKGMKSITSFTSSKKSDTTPPEPIPSNQEDILLDLENATGTHSQLISFDSKLDLPQTLTISTILKYRKYVVNVVDEYSSTPLLLATAMNKRDLVDMLLSMGGDISIASTDGQTPLTVATDHLIISSLQKKLMKLLKSKRTNNGKATTLSDTTSSTMSNSNLFGQKTVREFGLTLTETSIPSRVDEPTTILSQSCGNSYGLLMHLQQLSSKRYGYSKTALSWAVEGGLESIIEQLVHVGANVTASDAMGRTPLHHCVALAAEISADDCSKLEESIAAILKLRSIAEMLLNGGADVNAKTISGRTPLHEMFCRGSDLSSSTIILKRTSLDSCTNSICRAKSLFVRSLLHWGSDPLLQDRHGYSSMHYCARENMTFCLIEILKTDVDYFAPCLRGRNILHLACLHGCEATAEIICKWDADNSENGILFIQDLSGKIPRDLIPKDMNSLCLITLWSACREGNPLR